MSPLTDDAKKEDTIVRTPLTKDGHAKLQAELDELKTAQRPAVIRAIAEARAHGDLSENAEYHSAKDKQAFIEDRVRELEGVLGTAEIIDPAAMGADGRCIFGAFVELKKEDGDIINYRIVSRYETDVEGGQISSTSPLGRALLGKYKNDAVVVDAPGGAQQYTLLSVRYE